MSINGGNKNNQIGLIDWIQFTIFTEDLDVVYEFLGIDKSEWVEMPYGKWSYHCRLQSGNISILYRGREGMGIHVEMTGQGCLQYRKRFGEHSILRLIEKIFRSGGHFTRMDIALDDFSGGFTPEIIMEKLLSTCIISSFKNLIEVNKYFIATADCSGRTIYFGQPTSPLRIKFYDKARKEKKKYPWLRAEVQCRDGRAQVLASELLSGKPLGELAAGILNQYIRFVEPSTDSNKARWPASEFWTKYLSDVEKVKLTSDINNDDLQQSIFPIEKFSPATRKLIGKIKFKNIRNDVKSDDGLYDPDFSTDIDSDYSPDLDPEIDDYFEKYFDVEPDSIHKWT